MSKAQERALRGMGVWAVVSGGVGAVGLVGVWIWQLLSGVDGMRFGVGYWLQTGVWTLVFVGGGAWMLLGKPRVWVGWAMWWTEVWAMLWSGWAMYLALSAGGQFYVFELERVAFLWLGWVVLRRKWAEEEAEVVGAEKVMVVAGGEGELRYEGRVVREDVVWLGLRFAVVWSVVSGVAVVGVQWRTMEALLRSVVQDGMGAVFMIAQWAMPGTVLSQLVLLGCTIGFGWYAWLVRVRWRNFACGGDAVRRVGLGMIVLSLVWGVGMLVQQYEVAEFIDRAGRPREGVWMWLVNVGLSSLAGYAPAVAVYWWLVWPGVRGEEGKETKSGEIAG